MEEKKPIRPFKVIQKSKNKGPPPQQNPAVSPPAPLKEPKKMNTKKKRELVSPPSNIECQETIKTIAIFSSHFSQTESSQQKEGRTKEAEALYQKKVQDYISEGFKKETESYLRKFAANPRISELLNKFPIVKILVRIAKKFYLNPLEITFWSCFLEKNDWKYHVLIKEAAMLTDFMSILPATNILKALILYLCFSAFSIKELLNDRKEIGLIEVILNSILPNFLEVHLEWAKINSYDLKVSPIQLNTMYKKYQTKTTDFEIENLNNDYNTLVEEIVRIAPSYEKSELENNSDTVREDEEEKMGIGSIKDNKIESKIAELTNFQSMDMHMQEEINEDNKDRWNNMNNIDFDSSLAKQIKDLPIEDPNREKMEPGDVYEPLYLYKGSSINSEISHKNMGLNRNISQYMYN